MLKFISFFGKITLFALLFCGNTFYCKGQQVDSLQISLITCGSGEELYSTFGHSAVRVLDYSTGRDYAFNYGTFDFSDPHFYWKFVRGRLLYFLSVQDFQVFLQTYKSEDRKVTEQILNLTTAEKQAIFQFLKNNYLPANRYYKYNFLFDNCSTRIRDIFSKVFGFENWKVNNIIPVEGMQFRQVINAYLQHKPWEKLGINLVFGQRADQQMTNRDIMFLPHFLEKAVGHSSLNGKPLVERTVIRNKPTLQTTERGSFYNKPIFGFSLIALFIVVLTFAKPSAFSRMLLPWIDRCLFFLSGFLGCFLLFMWFGTDHKITAWNYNILWLLPFNIIFSFYFYKQIKWVRRYALLLLCVHIALLAGWAIVPQQLPLVAIPVMVAISVRAWNIMRSRERV